MTAGRSCRRLEPRHYGTTIAAAEEAVMGLYGERVLPRIINAACGMKTAEPLRRRVCEGLAGDVVEIGFGSGLNIPFYPAAVTQVAAVDPAEVGWKLADKRLRATTHRAGQQAGLRRVPPHPAGRRPADDRGLHHHRARRLLREGRPEVRGGRLPRRRPVSVAELVRRG